MNTHNYGTGYYNVSRKKGRKWVSGPRVFASAGIIQLKAEEWYTEYLQSSVEYLNKHVFLGSFKVWLVMDHDCHANSTTSKIDRRRLRKIAVPPEIVFVNIMLAAVDFGNRKVYRNFKLRLEIENLLPQSDPHHKNNAEVVA